MEQEKHIKSSDWLIKHYTDEQLVEMKGQAIRKAIEELEQKAKQEVAREIIGTLKREYKAVINEHECIAIPMCDIRHIEKKYIGE